MIEEWIEFPCLEINQPIGTFYVGRMSASDLLHVSYADVRRLEAREVELYLGIQRPLERSRVRDLQEYVRTVDASFPTSILLHVQSGDVQFTRETGTMRVRRDEKVAKILDGQHRIAGLEGYDEQFELNVVFFVDMDIEEQAMVFSTINLAQTKVNKSLVYDLFEFAKNRSPQKTCHQLCRVLNREEGSPFYRSIRILGTAERGQSSKITQATFVEQLLKHISKNPNQDREKIKREQRLLPDNTLVFRQLFIEERDAELGRIVWNYFQAVQLRWPDAWNSTEPGNLLGKSTGFIAFMRFLKPTYRALVGNTPVVTTKQFLALFESMNLTTVDFTRDALQYGSGGQKRLFDVLMEASPNEVQNGTESLFEGDEEA